MDYMKLAEKMSDVCTSTGGCDIPSAHRMTVKVGYDLSLAEKVSSSRNIADPTSEEAREAVEEWMEEAMTHCQALMWHCSLPTQITLDIRGRPTPYLDRTWTAESSISSVRQLIGDDDETNLYAFFCADPNYQGTVGIAYVGGICDTNGYQVSLNEWRNTAAASGKVAAHEMGHNMGLSHDFASKNAGRGCNGIMDYGNSDDVWSQCSREDFVANYELVTMARGGGHCMEVIEFDETVTCGSSGGGTGNGSGGLSSDDSSEDEEEEDEGGNSGEDESKEDDDSDGDGDDKSDEEEEEEDDDDDNDDNVTSACPRPLWRKDGFCDDENNTPDCGFDGGDCCDNESHNWDHFCQECECLEPGCVAPNWRGDGYCDDDNNVPSCDYDGGDCCYSDKKHWKHFCQVCECVDPTISGGGGGGGGGGDSTNSQEDD